MDTENAGLASVVPTVGHTVGEKTAKVDEKYAFDKDYETGSVTASDDESSEEVLLILIEIHTASDIVHGMAVQRMTGS